MAYTSIDDPAQYFNTVLYTGDIVDSDGTGHDQAITGVGFQPDFVWHKGRSAARQHIIVDSVRGTGGGSAMLGISSQDGNAASNSNTNGWIESLDSDGVTVTSGNDSSSKSNNAGANGNTYVIWNWKEDATAGFDIVTYTGNDTNRTISHSLSAVPHWILIKATSRSDFWRVYHQNNTSAPATDYLVLNNTDATSDNATEFQDTAPTSSVFTLGTSGNVNRNSESFVAYLWSEVKGFSKFGSYTGNGSTDGTFSYTGFKPAWLMIKRTDSANSWIIMDTKRNTFNPMGEELKAEVGDAGNDATRWDQLSNGFKLRNAGGAVNASGGSYIYMAFAESPFVNSNGIPTNAR